MQLQARRGGGGDRRSQAEEHLRGWIKNNFSGRDEDGRYPDGAFRPDQEGRQILGSMQKQLGVDPRHKMRGINGKDFVGTASKSTTYDQYLQNAVDTGYFAGTPQVEAALAEHYGVSALTPELRAKALADAQGRQSFMGSIREAGATAAYDFARNANDMVASGEMPEELFQLMPDIMARVKASAGPAAAEGFEVRVRNMVQGGNVKGALEELGIAAEQLKGVVPPEVNTVEGFNAPLLKDLPPWGQAVAIGGIGAGAGALAYHLMAQGQQQQSATDYAAAMQALNAY